jgi:hypothetical protein
MIGEISKEEARWIVEGLGIRMNGIEIEAWIEKNLSQIRPELERKAEHDVFCLANAVLQGSDRNLFLKTMDSLGADAMTQAMVMYLCEKTGVNRRLSFKRDVLRCDCPGCEGMRGDFDGWLEVVWGVHPQIVKNRDEPVCVVQAKYHFCPLHRHPYAWLPVFLMEKHADSIIRKNDFATGYGCWVTVIARGETTRNYQMSIEIIEELYRRWKEALSSRSFASLIK